LRTVLKKTTLVTIVTCMVIHRKNAMHTIQASEFKAKCLALMDAVATTGEVWVVTKNGKPVAELRPFSGQRIDSPFGLHRNLEIHGDVLAPLEDGLWKALA